MIQYRERALAAASSNMAFRRVRYSGMALMLVGAALNAAITMQADAQLANLMAQTTAPLQVTSMEPIAFTLAAGSTWTTPEDVDAPTRNLPTQNSLGSRLRAAYAGLHPRSFSNDVAIRSLVGRATEGVSRQAAVGAEAGVGTPSGADVRTIESCPPHLLEIGSLTLRIPAGEPGWTGISGRTDPRGLPLELSRCGDGQIYTVGALQFRSGPRLPMTFQNGCAPWGLARNTNRQECLDANNPEAGMWRDRPGQWSQWNLSWRTYFLDGMPERIVMRSTTNQQDRRRKEIDRRTFITTRLGNKAYVMLSSDLRPVSGAIFEILRSGERQSLLVQCASLNELSLFVRTTENTRCSVFYHVAPNVTIEYEFYREIFDEEEWAELDDRVGNWLRQRIARDQ